LRETAKMAVMMMITMTMKAEKELNGYICIMIRDEW
jgi:hypothetical protein